MTVDRARPWDGYSLRPELYALSRHRGAWKGCAFVVSRVREDLAFKKAPRRCHLGPVHSYPK